MKDYVKCSNCDFIGLIGIGEEACPACDKIGCLAWVDENNQEVRDDFLNEDKETKKSKIEIKKILDDSLVFLNEKIKDMKEELTVFYGELDDINENYDAYVNGELVIDN